VTVREQLERRERDILSPHATLAAASRGRERPEAEHDYRTAFQRDRDRILHTKAFRRLKRKTQVFLAPEADHFRTRLSHTLEVAQIARTVARALFLNEDLTEAIALGHDLGHTPFGHAGERALNEVYAPGFRHAEQSVRIVEKLESARGGVGLNLTFEVRAGIRNHSEGKGILSGDPGPRAGTLEGDVVSVCDAVAYVNHDIEDAVRAGVITLDDLPQDALRVVGATSAERIDRMACALITASQEGAIAVEAEVREATAALRGWLYSHLYTCDAIRREIEKAEKLLRDLYHRLLEHPTDGSAAGDPNDPLDRRTVDFVAGMTDQYALQLYGRTFFPQPWYP
jgi:dGTPase